MAKLEKKINIVGTLTLLTGLHIGGSSDNVEIGGIDNIVIRTARRIAEKDNDGNIVGYKIDNQPYIPGSSLKGKMRCLLEQIAGLSEVGGGSDAQNEKRDNATKKRRNDINSLFGITEIKDERKCVMSHLIVRDSYLDEDSIKLLDACENLSRYTENKYENSIKRVEGTAENPRQTERIPAGASFSVNYVVNVWDDGKSEDDLLSLLKEGLNALMNDYLGGSGSRGYGQIEFTDMKYCELNETNKWRRPEKKDWKTFDL